MTRYFQNRRAAVALAVCLGTFALSCAQASAQTFSQGAALSGRSLVIPTISPAIGGVQTGSIVRPGGLSMAAPTQLPASRISAASLRRPVAVRAAVAAPKAALTGRRASAASDGTRNVEGPTGPGVAKVRRSLESAVEGIGNASTPEDKAREIQNLYTGADASNGGAAVSADNLSQLNQSLAELLAPYNNGLTSARFVFNRVAVNADRATQLDFEIDYQKTGANNTVKFNVKPFAYGYEDGSNPSLDAKLALGLDLTKILSQEQINELGPQADEILKSYLEEYRSQYGDAAKLDARITRREIDEAGNLKAIGLAISFDIDLTKLPEGMEPSDVLVTRGTIELNATLSGVDAGVSVTFNPTAKQFTEDQPGLKDALEKVLARDPETLGELAQFIAMIDRAAESLVE